MMNMLMMNWTTHKCTKCDKFGHSALSYKSTTQNPNALKINVAKLILIVYMN